MMVFRSAVPSPPLKCLYNLTCILPDAEGAAGSQAWVEMVDSIEKPRAVNPHMTR